MNDVQHRGIVRRDAYCTFLVSFEGVGYGEYAAFQLTLQFTCIGFVAQILNVSLDRQPCLVEGLQVDDTAHVRMTDTDWSRANDADWSEETHALVDRARIPVYEADVGVARLGTIDLHLQRVMVFYKCGDIEFKDAERSFDRLTSSHKPVVQPDVCTIADALKTQRDIFIALEVLQIKTLLINPRDVETALVDVLVVHALQHVRILAVGREHAHDG